MKKLNTTVKTILIAALGIGVATGMTSCKKEGCTDANATNFDSKAKKDDGTCTYASKNYEEQLNDGSLNTLNADITTDVTLPNKEYVLSGGIHVKSGATLTIPAGAIFKSDPNETIAYLLIEQGAKIMAEGTESEPIVFTSGNSTQKRGDWGGIIICGKAPINGGPTRTAEVGNVLYGGSDAADNSGVLKFVRLEYTGNSINAEKEHNGFTFNGVGSGTVVQYLQVYYGGDDGFEWFGGTVQCDYLVSTGSKDDCFDWTYGWTGGGSNWLAIQASDEGDRGIEADNDSKANTNAPYSNPTLKNLTLTGRNASGKAAMKLRQGTKGSITNVLVTNFDEGINVEHKQTVTNAVDGSLKLSSVNVTGASSNVIIKGAGSASDSTSAYNNINAALNSTATGSVDFWTGKSWVKAL